MHGLWLDEDVHGSTHLLRVTAISDSDARVSSASVVDHNCRLDPLRRGMAVMQDVLHHRGSSF